MITKARVSIGSPGCQTQIYPVNPVTAKGICVRAVMVQPRQNYVRIGQLHFGVDNKAARVHSLCRRHRPLVRFRMRL